MIKFGEKKRAFRSTTFFIGNTVGNDISGELVRHTGLTVTYWVTVTYCGPTEGLLFTSEYHVPAVT